MSFKANRVDKDLGKHKLLNLWYVFKNLDDSDSTKKVIALVGKFNIFGKQFLLCFGSMYIFYHECMI